MLKMLKKPDPYVFFDNRGINKNKEKR